MWIFLALCHFQNFPQPLDLSQDFPVLENATVLNSRIFQVFQDPYRVCVDNAICLFVLQLQVFRNKNKSKWKNNYTYYTILVKTHNCHSMKWPRNNKFGKLLFNNEMSWVPFHHLEEMVLKETNNKKWQCYYYMCTRLAQLAERHTAVWEAEGLRPRLDHHSGS